MGSTTMVFLKNVAKLVVHVLLQALNYANNLLYKKD